MQEAPETLRSVRMYPLSESPWKGHENSWPRNGLRIDCARDDDSNYYLQTSVWFENSRGSIQLTTIRCLPFGHGVDTLKIVMFSDLTAPMMGLKGSYPPVLHPNSKNQRVCDDISDRRKWLWERFKTTRPRDSGSLAMCRLQSYGRLLGKVGFGESSVHVEAYLLWWITQPVRRQT